ncbi:YheC/YheD family protein [Lysinibacillus sp. LZ02]|uniref:YheC/YheD family protein n=1 Tax=Lysinibacillus sp. LZ02 TaxID=3420668 RepID=UPI003D3607BA
MKAARGRIGQYKILQQEQRLHPYLAPNEQFSKESLFSMLASHRQIILKPVYGTEFITIAVEEGSFHLNINDMFIQVSEKEDVYKILQREMSEQHYIIQPQLTQTSLWRRAFHRFVTVHKKTSNWQVTCTTKHSNHFFEPFVYRYCFHKMQDIALLVAQQLGQFYTNCECIVIEMAFNLKGDILIYDTTLHFSISKWNQYQILSHLMPQTDLLTEATFQNFLKKYDMVFLKPCNGQQGKDIIKVRKWNNTYEIYIGISRLEKQDVVEAYQYICQICLAPKHYIIQQGIPLTMIEDCFIDIRVMTQKVDGDWQVTGKAVKVAGHLFFITNAARAILPLEEALKQTPISPESWEDLASQIDAICLAAMKELAHRDHVTVVGFDVGVTDRGEVWIIEGNYVPDISIFKRLEDQTMYETILTNRNIVVKQPSEHS